MQHRSAIRGVLVLCVVLAVVGLLCKFFAWSWPQESEPVFFPDTVVSVNSFIINDFFNGRDLVVVVETEKGYRWKTQALRWPVKVGDTVIVQLEPYYCFRIGDVNGADTAAR